MRRLLLVIALALGASAAQAENGLFYLGAGISSNKLGGFTNSGVSFPEINGTSWKAFAGVRPISWFAVEADYLDLGSQSAQQQCTWCCMAVCKVSTHSDAQAFAGYALGFLPIPVPFLDIYGKVGLARWELNGSEGAAGSPFSSFSDHGTEFAWGVGAQAHVGKIGGRLEYESFNIPNTNGARVFSFSVFLILM
jgi:Outer membrane protein beta-barrel domain